MAKASPPVAASPTTSIPPARRSFAAHPERLVLVDDQHAHRHAITIDDDRKALIRANSDENRLKAIYGSQDGISEAESNRLPN